MKIESITRERFDGFMFKKVMNHLKLHQLLP